MPRTWAEPTAFKDLGQGGEHLLVPHLGMGPYHSECSTEDKQKREGLLLHHVSSSETETAA